MNKTMLEILGITKSELSVLEKLYLNGVLSALDLADLLRIDKGTSVFLLKNLEKKGLVSRRTRNNHNIFQARDPNLLYEKYKAKLDTVKGYDKDIKQYVSNYQAVQNYDSLNKIVLYDERSSVKRIMTSLIDGVQSGTIERFYNEKNDVEIYRAKDYIYLASEAKNMVIRFNSMSDYLKVRKIFKLLTRGQHEAVSQS